ncbi:MAG: C40 family peptidase [Filimonas sp.]|nr:C40 family peptidase [Filimonas sp.]
MKRRLLALLTCIISAVSLAQAQRVDLPINKNSFLDICYRLKGIHYKWAGATTKGFDCSGFIMYVFNKFNVLVSHSTKELATTGEKVMLSEAKTGDIIIFTGTKKKDRSPGHAGIVVSKEGEPLQFIHSSSSTKKNGVIVTTYDSSNYPARFLDIRRVTNIAD